MDYKNYIKKIEKKNNELELLFLRPEYKKVINFFYGKELLQTNLKEPQKQNYIDIQDVTWVADKLEPRVWEVLPAALIHFPKSFYNKNKLPKAFEQIVKDIVKGKDIEGTYKGIEIKKMKFWADRHLRDKRTKPVSKRKILKTFRLSPDCVKFLEEKSKSKKISQIEFLEDMIRKA